MQSHELMAPTCHTQGGCMLATATPGYNATCMPFALNRAVGPNDAVASPLPTEQVVLKLSEEFGRHAEKKEVTKDSSYSPFPIVRVHRRSQQLH